MEFPYTESELKAALFLIGEKVEGDEGAVKRIEETATNYFPPNESELKKKIAEFHGITVKDLISSTNYQILYDEYIFKSMRKIVELLKNELNLSDVQAWASVALASGQIGE